MPSLVLMFYCFYSNSSCTKRGVIDASQNLEMCKGRKILWYSSHILMYYTNLYIYIYITNIKWYYNGIYWYWCVFLRVLLAQYSVTGITGVTPCIEKFPCCPHHSLEDRLIQGRRESSVERVPTVASLIKKDRLSQNLFFCDFS